MKRDAQKSLQGAIQDQACQWIVRLRSDSAGEDDYQAFALWLAANPEHRAAMDAMLQLWGDLGVVRHLPESSEAAPSNSSRRRWLATGVALAASVCLALLLQSRLIPEPGSLLYQTSYRTDIGEQMSAELEDGSTVRLNTDTSLEISFSARQRQLTLHRGEAFFEVARNPDRPFVVNAGNLEVQALGTAFNVYLQGDTGVVTVTEGVVRVSERNVPGTRPPEAELLYRNQQLSGNRRGLGKASAVEADRKLAWREGRLVAEEMPLVVLVEELSRYHPNRIFIAEPQLTDRTVSGVFMLEDLDSILLALEHTAQVRSVTLEDGSVQLIGAPL